MFLHSYARSVVIHLNDNLPGHCDRLRRNSQSQTSPCTLEILVLRYSPKIHTIVLHLVPIREASQRHAGFRNTTVKKEMSAYKILLSIHLLYTRFLISQHIHEIILPQRGLTFTETGCRMVVLC